MFQTHARTHARTHTLTLHAQVHERPFKGKLRSNASLGVLTIICTATSTTTTATAAATTTIGAADRHALQCQVNASSDKFLVDLKEGLHVQFTPDRLWGCLLKGEAGRVLQSHQDGLKPSRLALKHVSNELLCG